MDAIHYQGLFHLSAGTAAFLGLLLVFRIWGERFARGAGVAEAGSDWRTKEPLEVLERVAECESVVTLRLRRKSGHPLPRFRPGQFLTVQIGADPKLTRSYSICSTPFNRENLQISVRLIAGGVGSAWMHGLKTGDELQAYPPSGHFSDDQAYGGRRVYVAGGIGITPILSMIQSGIEAASAGEMVLFYGMRSRSDLAFHSLLSSLAQRYSRFRYFPVLSHDDGASGFDRGFVTYEYMAARVDLNTPADFYLCGPPMMTEGLMERLLASGVADERLHSEKFVSPASFDPASIPRRRAQIEFSGQVYHYDGNQSLLEFLEGQGVQLPFACRTGVCGSCKCRAEGKLRQITDSGLTRSQARDGYVLTCVSYPDDALVKLST